MIAGLGLKLLYREFNVQALDELSQESHNNLVLFGSSLDGTLGAYEHLPKLISDRPLLTDVLSIPDSTLVALTNRLLEKVATTSQATDVYLMDIRGLTIAASNWNLPRSYIGKNFGFRPYFKDAIKQGGGRYFALGTTSLRRGYYFSHPIKLENRLMGVIVVKINLADIEKAWSDRGNHFLITDEDGIIFLSTNPNWTYQSIGSIPQGRLDEIKQSRRYAGKRILPLNIAPLHTQPLSVQVIKDFKTSHAILDIYETDKKASRQYLHHQQSMPGAKWTIHILTATHRVYDTVILRTSLSSFTLLILVLLVSLYAVNRQRRLALQGSTELLEQRVLSRTRDLEIEIEERSKAEQNLRDTQAELIQTAKMAGLGQMSAGISHELNQPLTAIRGFSENAQRMLDRNLLEPAQSNLAEIDLLTQKMAAIIGQLRGFSRKSSGERILVSIPESIDQALGMFHRDIESTALEVSVNVDPDLSVVTDPLLLNQVLVNIISNGIQAMALVDKPRVTIVATLQQGGMVKDGISIRICDIGSGISDSVIENIFDPFFTTKDVGLGLGLSISYRIMESLGGNITVSNEDRIGSCFELYLTNA
ncbi:MAG: two-component system C4-dicarboxylate transport sensor histidine kinase DctB [Polaribacter sp.]